MSSYVELLSEPVAVEKELKEIKSSSESPPELAFNSIIGTLPFVKPNVNPNDETGDIQREIAKEYGGGGFSNECMSFGCGVTGVGLCWLWSKMILVPEGKWAFVMHSGSPELLPAGRYFLSSPFTWVVKVVSQGDDVIEAPPITIVRVQTGKLGLASNNGKPEILLPGRHCRISATFKFIGIRSYQDELIEYGPVKLLTVMSGGVRVCYDSGKVEILRAGRYGINSATFCVAGKIITQQQNVKFSEHKVLLDGGVGVLVTGLLTFQVAEPGVLITQLGERDILQAVTQVTKAEIARVFASIHLEQISTAQMKQSAKPKAKEELTALGKQPEDDGEPDHEGERNHICKDIIQAVRPIASQWGVNIINFQLESLALADKKYAAEYEEASLSMAKAKAGRRAIELQNDIQIQKAKAAAEALRIEAEGHRVATLIQAEAKAESTKIDFQSRNDSAEAMGNEFARELAMVGQQVEFASQLKAKILTVIPEDGSTGFPRKEE